MRLCGGLPDHSDPLRLSGPPKKHRRTAIFKYVIVTGESDHCGSAAFIESLRRLTESRWPT